MGKVLIIANSLIDGMMLSYFMPYIVERGAAEINPNDTPQIPISRWYEEKPQTLENIDKFYKFKFEDTDIDFKFVTQQYTNIDEYINFAKQQREQNGYDRVFLFTRKLFIEGVQNDEFTKIDKTILEVIYLNVSEAIHTKDNTLKEFLKDKKVISCGYVSYTNPNFYYEPFLNLIYSYYQYGFDFYPYNQLEVKKQNLIGMYLKKNYKVPRDMMYNDIKSEFINKEIDVRLLEIYKEYPRPDFFTKFNCLHNPTWDAACHITSYLDYLTSVCAFAFETTNFKEFVFPYQSTNRQYITEKTLKTILYSKMDIPFIIDMNPINFIELHEMGFWFLNSEFFDFSKTKFMDELSYNMKNSIFKSIEYILELYKNNEYNLDKTHLELKMMYGDKMQSNYNLFMGYLNKPYNCEKLIKFILKDE